MLRSLHTRLILILACAWIIGSEGPALAQQAGRQIKVKSIAFEGNVAFAPAALKSVIQTRQARRWPWSRSQAFDQRRLDADVSRLRAFYRDRGFPEVRVRLGEVTVTSDGSSVSVRFVIEEGPPLLIRSLVVEGLEGLPLTITEPAAHLPLKAGDRLDNAVLLAARNQLAGLLREQGYPHVQVEVQDRATQAEARDHADVHLALKVTPGPETRFGKVTIDGLKKTKQVMVHRAVTFDEGELYRESEVNRSLRRLASLQAFEFVNLVPEAQARESKSAVLPMVITLAEGKRHRYEFGVGYGTEDRFRTSFEWRNLNFLGNASQLVANAKYSRLQRGAGFGYEHPYLLRSGGTLNAQASAWWTFEPTFESRTAGGRIGVRHEFGRLRRAGVGVVSGWDTTFTYRNELLSYQVTPEALADLGSVEQLIAFGLDPVSGRGDGTAAGVSLDINRRELDVPTDPHRGTVFTMRVAHVAPWLGGTFKFDELLAEARGFVPIGSSIVGAVRVRVGTLPSRDATRIPYSERYFLGGASSVRGWGRYQISPTSEGGLPTGGRTLFEANAELRFPLIGPVGAVAFVDAGQVGADSWSVPIGDLRYAVGTGLRYTSLIGVARADVGYQLNPIPGLRVNGQTVSRRWRLHFSIGHAF
ncbi:MAG: BamA/TamA family outer membrane protein [Vicinamibacterales bacterium]